MQQSVRQTVLTQTLQLKFKK